MNHTVLEPRCVPSGFARWRAAARQALVALLIALPLAAPANADTAPFSDCPPYLLVHGNGVNTSFGDAVINLWVLTEVVGTGAGRGGYEFWSQLAHAPAGTGASSAPGVSSLMADLLESYRLKVVLQGGGERAWAVFLRAVGFATGLVSDNPPPWWTHVIADAVSQMTGDYQAALTTWLAARELDSATQAVVDSHVALYKGALRQGQRVVVVAHSQGNLFANLAYQKLVADPEIGRNPRMLIVGVATPANAVASDPTSTKYVTSNLDMVVNGVRAFDPLTLPANVTLGPIDTLVSVFDSKLGHSFVNVYLSPSLPMRAQIVALVGDRIERLPQNCFRQRIETMGTYLRHPVFPGESDPAPTSLDLSLYAASPGATLDLQTRGSFYYGVHNSTGGGVLASAVFLAGGLFTPPAWVDPTGGHVRFPLVTTATCTTPSFETDIPEDFLVDPSPGNRVKMPAGATALLIAPHDCYWGDNGDENLFSVRVVVLPPNN